MPVEQSLASNLEQPLEADSPVVQSGTLRAVPDTAAWKRRKDESPPAFDAFEAYIAVRQEKAGGIREVARRCGKNASLIGRWSRTHDWVDRYRLYENHLLLVQEQETRSAMRQRARQLASRRIEIRDEGFDAGKKMVERAKSLLQLPVFEKESRKSIVITQEMVGQTIDLVTVLNFQQHPRDARLFAETGVKLMRLSSDMSTENFNMLDASDVDLDGMDEAQLEEYITKFSEMRRAAVDIESVSGAPDKA